MVNTTRLVRILLLLLTLVVTATPLIDPIAVSAFVAVPAAAILIERSDDGSTRAADQRAFAGAYAGHHCADHRTTGSADRATFQNVSGVTCSCGRGHQQGCTSRAENGKNSPGQRALQSIADRKRVALGKGVSGGVDVGGGSRIK